MNELGLVETFASLGTGGLLALIMFLVYRKEKKAVEERLENLICRDMDTREKHTEAITELATLLKRINGNANLR